jgi:hypothetical protein
MYEIKIVSFVSSLIIHLFLILSIVFNVFYLNLGFRFRVLECYRIVWDLRVSSEVVVFSLFLLVES